MPKHAADEADTNPATDNPLFNGSFKDQFCDNCKPTYEAFVEATIAEATNNPCPPVYYYRIGNEEFCALRIGLDPDATWEVRAKVREDGPLIEAYAEHIGAWVHHNYYDDIDMTDILLGADYMTARI